MQTPRKLTNRSLVIAAGAAALLGAAVLTAQISVRPDEPLGLSVRERRVQVIHSERPDVPGTSMALQQTDPWLAYQRGHSYFFHEWSKEDGVFSGAAFRAVGGATTSCGMCHNLPFRSPGAGGNAVLPIGYGLNTPHLFGIGELEMIAGEIRSEILATYDTNHNGFLDVPAETAGRRAVIEATPGVKVDYGALDDRDGDGYPDLNDLLKVTLVDAQGRPRMLRADGTPSQLGDPGIAGYDFAVAAFATSAGEHQFPTLRTFSNGVLRTVLAMAPDDWTSFQQVSGVTPAQRQRMWAKTSNAGEPQPNLELMHESAKLLADLAKSHKGRISEGELDLLEWFLLNHPAPAEATQTAETRHGRELLASLGCTSCHIPDWQIKPADPAHGFLGDRRFFDLEVKPDPQTGELQGHLHSLVKQVPGPHGTTLQIPRREGFVVHDIFTDLRHHEMGPRIYEVFYDADGNEFDLDHFKTPSLWGVGSTPPYGHDGASRTLDDIIRRHGGEAEAAERAYANASPADRQALIAFLKSLVLYSPDLLPTDLNGDGRISPEYQVAGRAMGPERFFPELLFRVPPVYRGWTVGPDGDRFFSYELLNREAAYGDDLAALVDRNHNGIPDIAEHTDKTKRVRKTAAAGK
ncbi:MAG TPA: di-heme oxidoredictase family protein [Thermoanaerobaculia bacterium]|nr:di-heme oxidoredictase family protein [Thermoanaerobaculia bacterium]